MPKSRPSLREKKSHDAEDVNQRRERKAGDRGRAPADGARVILPGLYEVKFEGASELQVKYGETFKICKFIYCKHIQPNL